MTNNAATAPVGESEPADRGWPRRSARPVADPHVALTCGHPARYPTTPPFDPPRDFPELAGSHASLDLSNHVYGAVRDLFRLLGLDGDHDGSAGWNPLGDIIRPGDVVLLKPNFLQPRHLYNNEWIQVVTHGSIVRAVADYVQIALGGNGTIILADAPATEASFSAVCRVTGTDIVVRHYAEAGRLPLQLVDIRQEEWTREDFTLVGCRKLAGDPRGYRTVRLNEQSEFIRHTGANGYAGPGYDHKVVRLHHHDPTHEYLISGSVMDADVVINLPKLKTHKLAGITCCIKNLVGINGDKTWLPHHTRGFPGSGGDQFPTPSAKRQLETVAVTLMEKLTNSRPRLFAPIAKWAKKVTRPYFGDTHNTVRNGSWYGNDTLWRMALDLNRALLYADKLGVVHDVPQRRLFQIVDAIIGGEGDGPMAPTARAVGALVGGSNPVAVDAVCARVMGFDYKKIPSIVNGFRARALPLASFNADQITIASNRRDVAGNLVAFPANEFGQFEPHFGWKNHIELDDHSRP